jgi:glycosyltransferase involved in cell wall biosynthesis
MRIAIIPAYEPEEIFIDVLKVAYEAGFKIIVVDDGSGPGFSEIFTKAKQYAHVISYPENKGKGHALKTAFSYIMDECKEKQTTIVTLDCDGQHKIKDVLKVCEISEAHPEAMILGSRKQSKKSPWKSRFGNGITKKVFLVLTGVRIQDTQTGLRAFNGSFLPMLVKISGMRFEYEMNMLLQLAKTSINMIEVPIETVYIQNNAGSHFRATRDSVSIYTEILKFSASSFIGFLVDYLLYSLILILTGARGILLSNILARVISATVNFSINYKYVFQSKELLRKSLIKYFALACCILICNSCLLYMLTVIAGGNPFVSKVLVEFILFIGSWVIQHTFVFAKRKGRGICKNG